MWWGGPTVHDLVQQAKEDEHRALDKARKEKEDAMLKEIESLKEQIQVLEATASNYRNMIMQTSKDSGKYLSEITSLSIENKILKTIVENLTGKPAKELIEDYKKVMIEDKKA